jgi:hypothetical protein
VERRVGVRLDLAEPSRTSLGRRRISVREPAYGGTQTGTFWADDMGHLSTCPTAGSERPTRLFVRLTIRKLGITAGRPINRHGSRLGGRETVDQTVLICEDHVVPCHAAYRTR